MLKLTPIKGKKTFENIFAEAKKFRSDNLNAFIRFRPVLEGSESNINNIYYAVSVSKKISKKAVVRNRIKRLLRESLRYAVVQPEFSENFIVIQNIIIIWRKPLSSPSLIRLYDIIPDLFYIIKSSINYFKENLYDSGKKNTNSSN